MIHHRLLTLILILGLGSAVRADMVLTAAGVAEGFKLTTFASGFTFSAGTSTTGVGPLGIAFEPSGVVLVSTWPGNLYRLPNHNDGQVMTNANIISSTVEGSLEGLTTLGGNTYVASRSNNSLYQVSTTNNFASVTFRKFGPSLSIAADLRTNHATGQLMVVNNTGILEVDPYSGASRLVVGVASGDGLAIDPLGNTAYLAVRSSNNVIGYDIKTGAQVFNANGGLGTIFSGTVDGMALGTGSLANSLFVNDNSGNLWKVNLSSPRSPGPVLIATGGTRGDFVSVDPTDGSLFITQTDRIMHLTAASGSGFATSVPEPSSLILSAIGFGGGIVLLKRRAGARRA